MSSVSSSATVEQAALRAGYRLEGVIARGGMGTVFAATQVALGRRVALKVVTPAAGDEAELRERFLSEIQLHARLDHPNVVTVFDGGESDGLLFLAMRLVDGPDLATLLGRGPLPARRTIRILSQVADALDAAHALGLVHRDVKPSNILLDGDDRAYLADLGVARAQTGRPLTRAGRYVGTLAYAAPEQILGEQATARSDVYALSAVMYECLTGSVPFPREHEAAVLYAHLDDRPPEPSTLRPELPEALDAVVARGLAKDPGARYASAGELMRDASRGHEHSRLTRDLAAVSAGRSHRGVLATAIVAAAVLGLLGVLAGRTGTHPARAEQRIVASSGLVTLSVPGGWSEPPRARAGAVPLSGALTLQPPESGLSLTVGLALAPPRLPTDARAVRLGGVDAWRYADGGVMVYVIPRVGAAAVLECATRTERLLAACERVVSSARVAAAVSFAAISRTRERVDRVLAGLGAERRAARALLAGARTRAGQVRQLGALRRAFAAAARDGRTALTASLAAALTRAAHAYARLEQAGLSGDPGSFARHARAVESAEEAVERELAALRREPPLAMELPP